MPFPDQPTDLIDMLYCPLKALIRYDVTVVQQTDSDVTVGQCLVTDRNPAFTILIRHRTVSDGEVQVCLLPQQLIGSDTVVRRCLIVERDLKGFKSTSKNPS